MTLHNTHTQYLLVGSTAVSVDTRTQWLHTSGDTLIALAFIVLALFFFYFLRRRQDLRQAQPRLVLLVVLLGLGATTHIAAAYSLWQPIPLLSGLLKALTAVTSVLTAVIVWPLIPRLLKVPSSRALQEINLRLQREIAERTRAEEELQQHRDQLESLVQLRTQDLGNTARRLQSETEQRMEAQEQVVFQASLLNQLESAIIVGNSQREIIYWNQYAETMLGWKREEVLGQPLQKVLIDKNEWKNYEQRIAQLSRDKRWEGDMQLLHKDGRLLPVHTSSTVLNGADEAEIGYAFVCFDMSSQVRSKNRLRRAKDKAEKAAVAKQDFLSTMSHEIRTPLNVVIGMARLLMDEDPKPEQIEYLKSLQFSANNLLVIINDILDFSKIEAGKVKLEKINFSAREVVEGVINSFSFRAEEKNIALKVVVAKGVPERLIGDQVRLTQVLNNLVSNAIKFTEQGFVAIYVKPLNTQGEHVDVSFEVRDSGIGISQNKIRTIFDSFTQAATDTTRKFGGTGLGLTICKKLVELQGGNIQVKSKEGIGSNFGFTLSYRRAEEQRAPAAEQEENYQLNNVRLLLVEDNPSNRMVACSFLGKMGVHVTTAENGVAALRTVQTAEFDIVLMDLQMPQMDGYEATQAIRQLGGQYESLPIVALTADVVSDVKERVEQVGMNGYLSKPFNPNALYRTISQHLNLSYEAASGDNEALTLHDIINKYSNDADFTTRLLASLRLSFTALPKEVAGLVESKDLYELRRLIHKLLPSIRMVENPALQQRLEDLKADFIQNSNDGPQINTHLQAVRELSTTSVAYVDRMIRQVETQKESLTESP